MSEIALKQCHGCKQWLPADREHFSPGKDKQDGFQAKCKSCRAEIERERMKAKRMKAKLNGHSHTRAVVVPLGTSETCGSCGRTTGNIVGDIDDITRERYGYLCTKCYKFVHDFGGDLNRVRKAIDYVEKTRLSRVAHKKSAPTLEP